MSERRQRLIRLARRYRRPQMTTMRSSCEVTVRRLNGGATFVLQLYGYEALEVIADPAPIHAALRRRGLDPLDFIVSPFEVRI